MDKLGSRVRGRMFPVVFRKGIDVPLVRLGSGYGGWWVPDDLGPDSICYLAGVGTDITFDVAMIERFHCRIWALDPTPRSGEWVARQQLPPEFTFLPKGLAASPSTLRFYAPENPNHVSHSVTNLQRTDDYFDAECTSVRSLMEQLGHGRVDVLKMDIEGAQHAVIDSLIRDRIYPGVLCIEFDQPERLSVTSHSVQALQAVGYAVAKVERFNMTLLHRDR